MQNTLPPMLGSQETGRLISVLGLPYLSEDNQSSLTLFSFFKKGNKLWAYKVLMTPATLTKF